jgi:hypothetical protein
MGKTFGVRFAYGRTVARARTTHRLRLGTL